MVAIASGTADAQEFLKDRRYAQGVGLSLGDFEIHPGISGEAGYDSNWFTRTSKTGPQYVNGGPFVPVEGAGMLRITPSLSIESMSQQRATGGTDAPGPNAQPPSTQFKAAISGTYREFLGSEQIRAQRNMSGNATARLDLGLQRPVGGAFNLSYTRTIQSSVVGDPNAGFNRSDVGGGAELVLQPGGGTLDFRFGYGLSAALYEQSSAVPFTSLTHEFTERARWRFGPRTSIFNETSLRFISYPYKERSTSALNGSSPVRTRLGLNGLITNRFSMLLAAGYGASFIDNASSPDVKQFESLNMQAEGTFFLTASPANEPNNATMSLTTLSVGYNRDFRSSLLGNFYSTNRGYTKLNAFFAGRVLLSAELSGEAMSFPDVYFTIAPGGVKSDVKVQDAFTNVRIGGTLYGEYRFTSMFGVNATVDYSQVISDVELPSLDPSGGISATQVFGMSWNRIQAFLGARFLL